MSKELEYEILKIVNKDDEKYSSFEEWFRQDNGYGCALQTSLGKFKYYGSERNRDEPSEYQLLFSLTNDVEVKYFAVYGYYDSWDGATFESPELSEVVRKTKVVEYWGKI
jgi:hypothetical protein